MASAPKNPLESVLGGWTDTENTAESGLTSLVSILRF
jgi:hypothetical protein